MKMGKHDNPKPMGCAKAVLRGKLTAIQTTHQEQESPKQLTLHTIREKGQGRPKASKNKRNHEDWS